MTSKWSTVINLANSIVGVSVLAMPFCFHKCGIILGTLSLCLCAFLTKKSCSLLLKAAHLARSRTYELLALHSYGPAGKITVELCIIGLLLGTCIAFFVIIGDLAPEIVHSLTGIQVTWGLRTFLMICCGGGVLLLGFMRNIQSLSGMSAMSIAFYGVFVSHIFLGSVPHMASGVVWSQVDLWKLGGLLQCLPIFSLAFACQTQLFVLYDALPEPSLKIMDDVVDKGVNLVTCIYCAVGIFGYVAFYDVGVKGDILTNYEHGFIIEALKIGFVLSVVISFPLMIFPCRASINSFITYYQGMDATPTMGYIPPRRFFLITLFIVGGTLIVGILIPNVEFVLGLNGATMGSMIAYILPALFFLHVVQENKDTRMIAKIVLIIGMVCFVSSTYSVINSREDHSKINPPGVPDLVKQPTVLVDVQKDSVVSLNTKLDPNVAGIGNVLAKPDVAAPAPNLTKTVPDENLNVPVANPATLAKPDSVVIPQPQADPGGADKLGPVVAPVEHVELQPPVPDAPDKRELGMNEAHHGGIARDIKSIIEESPSVSQREIDAEIAKLDVKKAEIDHEIMKLENQKAQAADAVVVPASEIKFNATEEKPQNNEAETHEQVQVVVKAAEEKKEVAPLKLPESPLNNVDTPIAPADHSLQKRSLEGDQPAPAEPAQLPSKVSPDSAGNYQTDNNKSRDLKSNEQDAAKVEPVTERKPLVEENSPGGVGDIKPVKIMTINPILKLRKKRSSYRHKKASVR